MNILSKNRFFTMIELLTVISIITILAAMLLPALNNATKNARSLKCLNNFSQFGKAALQYSMDYDDRIMPFHNNGTGSLLDATGQWNLSRSLPGAPTKREGLMAPYLGLNLANGVGEYLPVDGYYRHKNLYCRFVCPERSQAEYPDKDQIYFLGRVQVYEHLKISALKFPNRNAFLVEINTTTSTIARRDVGSLGFFHPGKTMNILFLGGNVMKIARDKVPVTDCTFWNNTSTNNVW